MSQQRLFVSDSFAVLEKALVTAVQTVKAADPLLPLTLVVPNDLLGAHLRHAVAWSGQGHLGLYTYTLTAFAREIAGKSLALEGWQPLPSGAAPLLMQKLLREVETRNYFAPLARRPGFPRDLLTTITDLQQAGVGPPHLRAFIEQAQPQGTYRHKLESLLALYDSYRRFVTDRRFYDEADLVERSIPLLAASTNTVPLIFYGFTRLTPLQRRLFEAAIKAREVLVFLPWRPGSTYELVTATIGWLTSLGLQYTPLAGAATQESALRHLQQRVFEERSLGSLSADFAQDEGGEQQPEPVEPDSSVLLLSAPGENREVREIGRAIVSLIRTHGLHFDEIGILLRDAAAYGPPIIEALNGLGIPCSFHGGLPLLHTRAGQAVVLLCQVLGEDYARSRVFEFLGVADPPFAALLGDQAIYAQLARWEACSLRAGVVRGAGEWRERLSHLTIPHQKGSGESDKTEDQHVLATFAAFMQSFIMASERMPRVNTWHGWAQQTRQLLRTYVTPTAHSAQVEAVLQRLGQLDLLNQQITVEEWRRSVTAALATNGVEQSAEGTTGVFVGDLFAARGVSFRAVIIPGLVEGRFPPASRQDPLLLDAERQHIGEILLRELPQRGRRYEEERLAFTLAVQSAREHLVLTYPRLDPASGRAYVPSSFLWRTIEALTGEPASLTDLEERCTHVPLSPFYDGPPSRAVDTIEFHLASVEHALAAGDPASLGYLPLAAPFFSRALHSVSQRWDLPYLTVCDGMIEDEAVRRVVHRYIFPTGMMLSASALETYARCPFRYFLETILGLVPHEDPEQVFLLRPRDRGALLHHILHDFFFRLREGNLFPLAVQERTALIQLLSQVVQEHCQTFARTTLTGFPLLWEIEQERIQEQLAILLQRESQTSDEFLPVAFEAHFGEATLDEPTPFFPVMPVRFLLEDGEEIRLHGRIDRIELSRERTCARILDYKTGKPIRGRFAGGMALQLPLYLFAAQASRPDLTWESAAYAYIGQQGKSKTPLFTADTWPEALATLRQIVTTLVQGIRSGWFFSAPDSCSPCPFSLVCGAQAEARAAGKQKDPRLEPFRWLRTVA